MSPELFPVREKPAKQTGPYLLDKITPSDLKQEMSTDVHALSSRLMRCDLWDQYVWNGTSLTAPLMALRAAEANGLYTDSVSIAIIVNAVNKDLLERGKKPITDNSVLSNLLKAAKYLQAAFHIVIQPNRQDMNVSLLKEVTTIENLEKWFAQIDSKVKKIAILTQHAKASDFRNLEALTGSSPTVENFRQLSASLESIGATNE